LQQSVSTAHNYLDIIAMHGSILSIVASMFWRLYSKVPKYWYPSNRFQLSAWSRVRCS